MHPDNDRSRSLKNNKLNQFTESDRDHYRDAWPKLYTAGSSQAKPRQSQKQCQKESRKSASRADFLLLDLVSLFKVSGFWIINRFC
jgi:hypothetical protein